MRRFKYGVRGALLLVAAVLASLVGPSGTASAASDYDSVIESVNSVHLSRDSATQGSPTCALIDIANSWSNILLNEDSWDSNPQLIGGATYANTVADFNTTLSNEVGWSVSQVHYKNESSANNGPFGDYVRVVFTPSTTAQVLFSSDAVYWGAQKQAYMTNTDDAYVYAVVIQFFDKGATGGADVCTPIVSQVLREPSSTPSFKENESVATTSTSGYDVCPLFINAPITYPSGYEGELALTEQPPATYVAMGDSYSTAEGNPSFEHGTDQGGVNECHRSPQAYSRLLQSDPDLNLGTMSFVACSGATTSNVLGGQWNEPAQVNALSSTTEVVSITIGGNDVGFSDYVLSCTVLCGYGTPTYSAIIDAINAPALKSTLEDTYRKILEKAPQAQVYVLDYPYLTPANILRCGEFDFSGARDVQIALNSVIASAVANVGGIKLHYVPTNGSGSPFSGKYLCGEGASDFNGATWPLVYSFHPNASGQQDYAAVLKSAMS